MEELTIPEFENKKDLFDFLVANKGTLEAQKKAETKEADGFTFALPFNSKTKANKADVDPENVNELFVKAIINTTNVMDSHSDVHLKGIWTKSLKENKNLLFAQEHETRKFSHIIADGNDLKAYVKEYTFKELGFNLEGKTQALVFEATVKRDRNPEMFKQYSNGWVKEHSVGMRYVKLILAINDENYAAEFDAWEKYYPEIANKSLADDRGYFWAVKEAKAIEGSAVPKGSNSVTPTLEVESKNEPLKSTHEDNEPSVDTQNVNLLKGILTHLKQ